MILNNKKILLISPSFFNYQEEIKSKMQNLGAEVDFFDERPGNDFITKLLIRIDKSLLVRKIDKYYQEILLKTKAKTYDFVLFLNPESISKKKLQKLKKTQRSAIFIIYMWDSVKNKKNVIDLIPYFDLKYSFDKTDCSNPKFSLKFRPLFFLDEYKNFKTDNKKEEIDLLFVGTVHSDRYKLLKEIKEKCTELNINIDFFMFFQSKNLFLARKVMDKNFRIARKSEFQFSSLKKEDLIEKVKNSKVILDIQHPSQKGLTMRTIEMIGAKKKIITTNKDIKSYDFYNANNIYCIDRNDIQLDDSFFKTGYHELDEGVYKKYSIEGWIRDVFNLS